MAFELSPVVEVQSDDGRRIRTDDMRVGRDRHAVIAHDPYESLGLTAPYDSVALRFTWSAVDDLPLGGALDLAIDPEPPEDGEVESACGLVPGLLAGARARGGRVIAVARRGERMAGLAVFGRSIRRTHGGCSRG